MTSCKKGKPRILIFAAAMVSLLIIQSCATTKSTGYTPPAGEAKRIVLAQISQETNIFSPVPTGMAEFEAAGLFFGGEILKEYEGSKSAIGGFMEAVKKIGQGKIEIIPIIRANAVSGGPLERNVYEYLVNELIKGLRSSGRVDGIYIVMHGAMGVMGLRDPEGDILERVREVVGAEVPVVVSFDLHANVTKRRIDLATAIVGYKTNPHRDFFETGYTSGEILIKTVFGEIEPVMEARKMALLSGGGMNIDFIHPMNKVFSWMKKAKRNPEVLDISNFMVHIWLDEPDLGWTTLAITDGNRALASKLAEDLAEKNWQVRKVPIPAQISAEEAVKIALKKKFARAVGTIVICDVSDAVGAGAPGENTWIARAFVEGAPELVTYIPIRDPFALERIWSNQVGEKVQVDLGGNLEKRYNKPLTFFGEAIYRGETEYGRTMILKYQGIHIILTEIAATASTPSFFTDLGLSLWKADVTVVKNLFPFRYNYILYNRKTLDVATPGITDVNCLNLEYTLLPRPIYPYDDIEDWRKEW